MRIFKLGDNATDYLQNVTIIGVIALVARLLMWTDQFHSGLLYIAIPFGLSLALYYLTPHTDGTTWKKRFWNNLRISMIVMFAASLILMEGYVCVIMFMPIFFFFTLVAFISSYLWNRFGNKSIKSYALPAIIMVMSLEGTMTATTFNRYNAVTYSQIIQGDVESIKQKLTKPVEFHGDRHWMLSLFPMPHYVGTVSLSEGKVRRYDFLYHRWFISNTHAGSVDVLFSEVGENHIKTTINDTSYISHYMKLHGTEVTFDAISNSQTRVTLTITFDRTLDPLWYFEPLQRFAVQKGAQYFVNEILATKQSHIEGDT